MIKKFNLKLILLECFPLIFIISGIKRLYVAYNSDKIEAIIRRDWDRYNALTDIGISDFMANQVYWILIPLVLGIVIVWLINLRSKFGLINSITVLAITSGISVTGFYGTGTINEFLNYFCGFFSKQSGISYSIGGLILLLVGIIILWKTVMTFKNKVDN